MSTEKFEMVAKTFQGLEGVLAKELVALGAEDVQELRRGVSFVGDKELLYRANFFCRTALRILKPIFKFEADSADEVYEKVKEYNWEQYIDVKKTFAVEATVFSDVFRHSQYLQYRVKDGIADRFVERENKRPSVRITNPDVLINIHVADRQCTISLDSSGESLHKRGYRVEQTKAPINEVLAAGMLMLAGWDGQSDFMDPMCGSGTIVIEAAMMALGLAPGLYRKSYTFQTWPDYDEELFASIYNDESYEREFEHTIYGSDILRECIDKTMENVKSASVGNCVKLSCIPFEDLTIPQTPIMIMFNPPYGERLKPDKLELLYEKIGKKLKEDCVGKDVWIITEPNEHTSAIRLAPAIRYNLLNGSIECEFRKYEMFAGRREDYYKGSRKQREDEDANTNNSSTDSSDEDSDSSEKKSFGKERRDRDERGGRDRGRSDGRRRNDGNEDREGLRVRKYLDENGRDLRETDRLAYLRRRHEEQAEREERFRKREEEAAMRRERRFDNDRFQRNGRRDDRPRRSYDDDDRPRRRFDDDDRPSRYRDNGVRPRRFSDDRGGFGRRDDKPRRSKDDRFGGRNKFRREESED